MEGKMERVPTFTERVREAGDQQAGSCVRKLGSIGE